MYHKMYGFNIDWDAEVDLAIMEYIEYNQFNGIPGLKGRIILDKDDIELSQEQRKEIQELLIKEYSPQNQRFQIWRIVDPDEYHEWKRGYMEVYRSLPSTKKKQWL